MSVDIVQVTEFFGDRPCRPFAKAVGDRSLKEAWEQHPDGAELLWCLGQANHLPQSAGRDELIRLTILAACICAEQALQYIPPGDRRAAADAICVTKAYCAGKATTKESQDAAHAAAAYAAAARAVATGAAGTAGSGGTAGAAAGGDAATGAARAAVAAARAAVAPAGAYIAADYAAVAAAVAAAAAGDNAPGAKKGSLRRSAEIVRQTVPWTLVERVVKSALAARPKPPPDRPTITLQEAEGWWAALDRIWAAEDPEAEGDRILKELKERQITAEENDG
jgi:hypothetical protein